MNRNRGFCHCRFFLEYTAVICLRPSVSSQLSWVFSERLMAASRLVTIRLRKSSLYHFTMEERSSHILKRTTQPDFIWDFWRNEDGHTAARKRWNKGNERKRERKEVYMIEKMSVREEIRGKKSENASWFYTPNRMANLRRAVEKGKYYTHHYTCDTSEWSKTPRSWSSFHHRLHKLIIGQAKKEALWMRLSCF